MADRSRRLGGRIAANRGRQRELYGAPLGDRVRRLTAPLGISQARLARALGLSPAMLSQLVSGRRVKIGDPAVLARMLLLDQRWRGAGRPGPGSAAVEALLAEVARAAGGGQLGWPPRATGAAAAAAPAPGRRAAAADALRGVAEPARLAAAAAALAPTFPELAEVLRQARPAGATGGGVPAVGQRSPGLRRACGVSRAGNVEYRVRLQSVAAATVFPGFQPAHCRSAGRTAQQKKRSTWHSTPHRRRRS